MTKQLQNLNDVLAQVITLDMQGHPDWNLSHVARLQATQALQSAAKERGK